MDWYDDFLASARLRGVKASTLEGYDPRIVTLRRSGLPLRGSEKRILGGLAKLQAQFKPGYYAGMVVIVKDVLRRHGRRDVADAIPYPRMPDRKTEVERKVISAEDRKRLIEEAPTLFLRLLLSLFDESGARIAEIAGLKIRNVQFDEYSAILTLTGKTGTRSRRVFDCVPDLRRWLNDHPCRDDPEAPFFGLDKGPSGFHPYTKNGLRCAIERHALRVLKRHITPHYFRHSRATDDARLLTDREMMALNGWNAPHTVGVYTHLSMRDVDDKILVLHGKKSKEEIMRPIMHIQKCKCGQENAPVAIYCVKCGSTLAKTISEQLTPEIIREEVRRILKEQGPELLKELARET